MLIRMDAPRAENGDEHKLYILMDIYTMNS